MSQDARTFIIPKDPQRGRWIAPAAVGLMAGVFVVAGGRNLADPAAFIHSSAGMSTPAAFVCVAAGLAVDWWAIGPDWFRDRLAYTLGLAGLAGLAVNTGYQGAMSTRVAEHLTYLSSSAVDNIALVLTVGCTTTAGLVLAFSAGAMAPPAARGFLGKWVNFRFRRPRSKDERGPGVPNTDQDPRICRRLWGLALALVVLRPFAWGMVGFFTDFWVSSWAWWWGSLVGGFGHV